VRKKLIENNGFSMIELMVIVAILGLLAAIAIPNYIRYRDKGYCSQAETDANNVSRVISDYFAVPTHETLPTISDLNITPNNPVEISGDPNTEIIIIVTDDSGRCPDDYQKAHEGWDYETNTYEYIMK
jgi:prepilin-type N-terminal cleavage/methylation domain-containing protein